MQRMILVWSTGVKLLNPLKVEIVKQNVGFGLYYYPLKEGRKIRHPKSNKITS